jgi:hypothetical protein
MYSYVSKLILGIATEEISLPVTSLWTDFGKFLKYHIS